MEMGASFLKQQQIVERYCHVFLLLRKTIASVR
jgi:hypothetical protein